MKTQTAIKHFGGVSALAEALGCSAAAIYQWGEEVPAGRVFEIHVKSGYQIPWAAEPAQEQTTA